MSDKTTFCLHCNFQLPMCYETQIDNTNTAFFCINCGFSSNTMMTPGSKYFKDAVLSMPQLYIDSLYLDELNKYWYPTTVNMPDKGMVFLNGASLDDCEWAAIKATPVLFEEKEKFKIPGSDDKYFKFKMDKDTMKTFGKNGFMDALAYIGVIENAVEQ